jgi:hypothetical protein
MSQQGKRSGGIFQRFVNWAAGTPPPSVQQGLIATGGNQQSQWPGSYDDTPTQGDVYVGGVCCRTVGEVKAQTAKFYGHDIE